MTVSPQPLNPSAPPPFSGVFAGKTVWISGHTGFKGSWLCLWLLRLGAKVHGFSLPPPTVPSLFEQLEIRNAIQHETGDIRDAEAVRRSIQNAAPDFVFHLAAQSLVRQSYEAPAETFSTNVMGAVHVLEALRPPAKPCAAVIVTSDKCYENREDGRALSESDPLGGRDPYSASKAACEIVAAACRDSFFQQSPVAIATARAGNVIGGGDWAADRLIPDCIRALSEGRPVVVRNPGSVRPWQHVLEPLGGYLRLAQLLSSEPAGNFASAFNFGPDPGSCLPVMDVVSKVLKCWPGTCHVGSQAHAPAEARLLRLCTDKAAEVLGWRPVWGCDAAIERTVRWYQAVRENPDAAKSLSLEQTAEYEKALADHPWSREAIR